MDLIIDSYLQPVDEEIFITHEDQDYAARHEKFLGSVFSGNDNGCNDGEAPTPTSRSSSMQGNYARCSPDIHSHQKIDEEYGSDDSLLDLYSCHNRASPTQEHISIEDRIEAKILAQLDCEELNPTSLQDALAKFKYSPVHSSLSRRSSSSLSRDPVETTAADNPVVAPISVSASNQHDLIFGMDHLSLKQLPQLPRKPVQRRPVRRQQTVIDDEDEDVPLKVITVSKTQVPSSEEHSPGSSPADSKSEAIPIKRSRRMRSLTFSFDRVQKKAASLFQGFSKRKDYLGSSYSLATSAAQSQYFEPHPQDEFVNGDCDRAEALFSHESSVLVNDESILHDLPKEQLQFEHSIIENANRDHIEDLRDEIGLDWIKQESPWISENSLLQNMETLIFHDIENITRNQLLNSEAISENIDIQKELRKQIESLNGEMEKETKFFQASVSMHKLYSVSQASPKSPVLNSSSILDTVATHKRRKGHKTHKFNKSLGSLTSIMHPHSSTHVQEEKEVKSASPVNFDALEASVKASFESAKRINDLAEKLKQLHHDERQISAIVSSQMIACLLKGYSHELREYRLSKLENNPKISTEHIEEVLSPWQAVLRNEAIMQTICEDLIHHHHNNA